MPELMTIEELEQYLRFTRKTIYKLLKRGDIPAVKIGNKWRFDRERIDKWLHRDTERVKLRILVIDDDDIILSLFKETLEEEGYAVVTADSGTKGITYIENQDFDLIFLDLKIPGTNGAEIFQELKSIKRDLPVIIITGFKDSEMMERAMKQGPFGVMLKPFNDLEITSAVSNFLYVNKKLRRE